MANDIKTRSAEKACCPFQWIVNVRALVLDSGLTMWLVWPLGCERRPVALAWTQEEKQLDTQPREEPPHVSADSHSLLQDTELWGSQLVAEMDLHSSHLGATLLPHHSQLYLLCAANRAFNHSTVGEFSNTELHDNKYSWAYIQLTLCMSL